MIAVIGAHPDDAELGAGGILGARGGLIVALTNGDNHTRCPQIAEKEQIRSAEILLCDYVICPHQTIAAVTHRIVSSLDRIFEEYGVNTVITHHPQDSNQEHAVTASAVIAASRRIDRVMFFEGIPPSGRIAFKPQMYFALTEVWAEKKYAAISEYHSQVIRRGRNLADTRKALDQWRGAELGVEYAEAFECLRWTLD